MKFLRLFGACLALFFFLLSAAAFAEGAVRAGEWVSLHDPETVILTLREDGTAVYGKREWRWQDTAGEIALTNSAGEAFRLVYEPAESGVTFWLPARFARMSEIGADGEIVGTWVAEGTSDSSFVFTEEGRFLEDGVFTGSFVQDSENGRITLKYLRGMFEDTVILYSFDESALVISYPWLLSHK